MTINVELLKPAIGAKVFIDRSDIGDPAVSKELLTLLERHTVLVFPEIHLTDAEQLALTDALGERVNISAEVPGRASSAVVRTPRHKLCKPSAGEGARATPHHFCGRDSGGTSPATR